MVPLMFRRIDARSQQLLTLLLVLGVAMAMIPLWVPRLLPLLDLPNHLAAITIWNNYHSPEWGFQRFYDLSTPLVPYWGYYFPVHALSWIFSVETSNKIFLSIYAASVPLSMLVAARQFGRDPWVSILSLPFIFNYNLMYGFISYCAGIPLIFLGVVCVDRALNTPSQRRLMLVLICSFAVYFMHLLNWFVFGLCAIGLLLLHVRRWRTALTVGLYMAPSVAFALWNVHSASEQKVLMTPGPVKFTGAWLPGATLITDLPHRLLLDWTNSSVSWLLLVLLVSVIFLVTLGAIRHHSNHDLPLPAGRYSVEVMLLITMVTYCFLPFTMRTPFHWWNVGPRVATIAAMFFLLLPRGERTGWFRLLFLPALLISFIYPLQINAQFRSFNERAMGMVRLAERIPRGSLTLTLTLGEKSDVAIAKDVVPYTEFPAYPQILAGGFNHVGWKSNFPFRLRSNLPPSPHWARPTEFRQEIHGYHYDYVITQNEPVDGFLFGQSAPRVPLIARDGAWRLYQTRGIR